MAASWVKLWENIWKRRFVRMGLPFVVFIAGGSFFLKQFTGIRYEFRQGRKLTSEEAATLGLKVVDIREAEKEMLEEIEQLNVDKWVNIRGPRPWEDSKAVQDEQRQKLQGKPPDDKR